MSLFIDTTTDTGNGLVLTAQDRADALAIALEQCKVPADAGALWNAEFKRMKTSAARGFPLRAHYVRMQACEARRKELEARLQGGTALSVNPDMGE